MAVCPASAVHPHHECHHWHQRDAVLQSMAVAEQAEAVGSDTAVSWAPGRPPGGRDSKGCKQRDCGRGGPSMQPVAASAVPRSTLLGHQGFY